MPKEDAMKIVILDGHSINPGDLSWDALKGLGELTVFDRTPEDVVVLRARGAEALLVNKVPLTAAALSQLPRLRYIGAMFTGYDEIDVQAAHAQQIVVTNVPTYATGSVAELVFSLLFELARHVGVHDAAVHAGEWSSSPDFSFWKTPLIELEGKTMGLIGFGRIGRLVGQIATALGMRVIAFNRSRKEVPGWPGFRWCELNDLLPAADVVSLHCPLTPETSGIINSSALSKMKPSAFLINTARGPLIVEEDLARALNEGRLAGAGIDVLSSEPPAANTLLLQAKNCIITPHIGWATKEARARLIQEVASNLRAFLEGHPINMID